MSSSIPLISMCCLLVDSLHWYKHLFFSCSLIDLLRLWDVCRIYLLFTPIFLSVRENIVWSYITPSLSTFTHQRVHCLSRRLNRLYRCHWRLNQRLHWSISCWRFEAQGAGGCNIGGSVITGVCTMSSVTGGCASIWQCWWEVPDWHYTLTTIRELDVNIGRVGL